MASGTSLQPNIAGTFTNTAAVSIVGTGLAGTSNPGALYFGQGGATTSTFNAPLTLGAATTISSYGVTMNETLGGVISGTGPLTLSSKGGSTTHSAVWTLNAASTYSGNTTILNNAGIFDVTVKLGVDNALPTTTSLNLQGLQSSAVASFATLDLNGHPQQLAGLTDTGSTDSATQGFGKRVINSSATLATLTINNAGAVTYGTTGTNVLAGTIGGNTAANVAANNLALTKSGAGTLTLSGANTYAGATTINAGTLAIASTGSLANTAIGVTGTGTFVVRPAAGTVNLGNAGTASAGATLNLSSGTAFSMVDAAVGTTNLVQGATFGTALTLNAATLNFELNGTTTDKLAVTGTTSTVSVNGTNTINITPLAAPAAGTYNLITTANAAGGLSTGGTFRFANGLTTTLMGFGGNNYPLTLVNSANSEALTVGSAVGALTWTGQTAGTGATDVSWNTTGSTNWALGAAPSDFNNGSAVTFQDTNTVATGNVAAPSLAVSIQAAGVSPFSTTFDNTAVDYTVSNASGVIGISGTGGLNKLGTGTVTLASANTYTGATVVSLGTLNVTGNTTGTANVTVGNTVGNAVLNVPTGGSLIGTASGTSPTITLGTGGVGSVGALNITGGSVNLQGTETTDGIAFGASDSGYGAFYMSSGSFTQQRFMFGGIGTAIAAGGVGVGLQTGGTVNSTGWMILGRAGASTGVFTSTGGTLNHAGAAQDIAVGLQGTGRAELNVAGGLIDNTGRRVDFSGGTTGTFSWTGTGLLNLNAGTLLTNAIFYSSGTAYANFNGGTLKAAATNASFMNAITTGGAYVNGAFGTFAGGAVIDTNTFNATIAANLLAPTGNGVATVPLTSGGSGYVGAPYVQITGGGGAGATGYATINQVTGAVTGIVITNPGIGYTSAPSVTLAGGGGSGAVLGASTLATNTSGGLTKNSTGTLTLSGANTYTGLTTVSGGMLLMSNASALGGTTNGTIVSSGATLGYLGATSTLTVTGEPLSLVGTGSTGTNGALYAGGTGNLTWTGPVTLTGNTLIHSDGGSAFNFTSTSTIDLGSFTLTVDQGNGANNSFAGIISGAGGITKSLGSTVVTTLSAANTFTGATTINAGILSLGNVGALGGNNPGVNGTSGITMATGTTLRTNLTNGAVTVYAPITTSGNVTINAPTTNTGLQSFNEFILNGAIGGTGNVTFSNAVANANTILTVTLNAASNYSGTTTIDNTAGTAGQTFVKLGATNALPTTTVLNILGQAGTGTGRGIGLNLFGFSQTLAGLTNTAFTSRVQEVVNSDVSAPATLTINGATNTTFSGNLGRNNAGFSVNASAIPGSTNGSNFGLTKNGTGTFTISGSNPYFGVTKILGGILSLGNANAMQNSPLDTLNSIAGDATNGLRTTVATLAMGGLTGDKNLSDVFTTTSGGYSGLTALTLNVATGSNLSYSGSIADGTATSLTKNGLGAQTLSGANTFTGATAINAGTVTLDYSIQDNSKLSDTAALTLGAATLDLSGGTHAEAVLSTTLTAGTASRLTRSSGTVVLQMNAITNGALATIDFGASGIATTDTPNNAYGILGPWATIGSTDFAVNSTNGLDGLITTPTYTDVTRRNGGTQVIADGSTTNVRIIEGTGSAGNITLSAATTTISTLTQSASGGTSAATIDSGTQTLLANAILVGTGAGSLTIGNGNLAAATPNSDLVLSSYVANGLIINSVIVDTSTSSLTKMGTGTVALTNANTYTGQTTINAGTLQLGAGGTTGSLATSSAISMVTPANLTINRSNAVVQGTDFSGAAITGTGSFTQAGSGTTTLNAANSYTGPTTISAGVLSANSTNALGTGVASNTLIFAGGTLQADAAITSPAARTVSLTSTGIIDTNSNSVSIAGVASGAGGLTKNGVGTLTSSAFNTFTGPITINGGTLEFFAAATGTLYGSTQININNGATLKISAQTGNQDIYNGRNYTFDSAGGGSILVGTGNYNAVSTPFSITTNGGARDTIGLISTSGILGFNIGATVCTFNVALGSDATSDLTVNPTMGNAGGVTKIGTGRLTFTGVNTYSGATTVNGGTLILGSASALGTSVATVTSGSLNLNGQSATNTVSVGTAGTLTGSGSTGAATLAGSVTPGGAGSGLITMTSATVASTSAITLQLPATGTRGVNYDALTVSSALALDGTITVDITGLTPAPGQSFDLIDSTGSINVTNFNVATDLILPALSGGLAWDTSAFASTGVVSIVNGDPYIGWAASKGLTGGNNAKGDDPDNDGRNNLYEFAFDGNPLSGANDGKIVGKIATVGSDQVMTLTLPVRTGATFTANSGDQVSALIDALYYKIEGDVNLGTFANTISEVTPAITAGLPTLSTGWTYRTFREAGTVPTVSKVFLRAKISDTP